MYSNLKVRSSTTVARDLPTYHMSIIYYSLLAILACCLIVFQSYLSTACIWAPKHSKIYVRVLIAYSFMIHYGLDPRTLLLDVDSPNQRALVLLFVFRHGADDFATVDDGALVSGR